MSLELLTKLELEALMQSVKAQEETARLRKVVAQAAKALDQGDIDKASRLLFANL